ncbi:MAG: hypothetical protein E7394_05680 [Ruminococcaceae bacterium]|nr:hypothetical protein [Oscillospiraceae bacterium]
MWKNKFEITDFHSHILPGMDDGAKDLKESLKMLEKLLEEGVDKVIATSHYYQFREDVPTYVERRDRVLYNLESYIKEHDIYLPEIVPACEVRIWHGMSRDENLSKLTVGESKYILLEMPYDQWTDWMFAEVYSVSSRGFIPIMAHLERYVDLIPEKTIIQKLLSLGVHVQCNAESLKLRKSRKFMKKLIKHQRLTVLGTDCHNLDDRPPEFNYALEYISSKFGDEALEKIMTNANIIISSKR